jgi:5-methylcytosine-specific restriction endonuclease McrA
MKDAWTRRWHLSRRVRQAVLERDGYRCQIGAPGCLERATQVDHIVPRSHGGAMWDPDNLRAACERCNQGRRVRWASPSAAGPSREW